MPRRLGRRGPATAVGEVDTTSEARDAGREPKAPSALPERAPGGVIIPDRRYFRIGEVASLLDVKPHVLRYWETEFSEIRPQKSRQGHRLYRRRDVQVLVAVRKLLHEERYTIAGGRERLKEILAEDQLEMFTTPKVPLVRLDTTRLTSLSEGLRGLLELLDRRDEDLARDRR